MYMLAGTLGVGADGGGGMRWEGGGFDGDEGCLGGDWDVNFLLGGGGGGGGGGGLASRVLSSKLLGLCGGREGSDQGGGIGGGQGGLGGGRGGLGGSGYPGSPGGGHRHVHSVKQLPVSSHCTSSRGKHPG